MRKEKGYKETGKGMEQSAGSAMKMGCLEKSSWSSDTE